VIQIGYITNAGEEIVTGEYPSPPESNAALYDLRDALADRNDIQTLFIQSDFGEGLVRYGFMNPIEA
jgi:hypothetical protein